MKTKYTPGPWTVKKYQNITKLTTEIDVEESKGEDIAILVCSEANANLIALAPTIFNALKEAKWFIDHIMGKEKRIDWGNSFNMDWFHVNNALIEIDQAIYKVEEKRHD